jgi:hypothetical protein
MIPIMALWLPILLSAVIVFIASSIIHMVLGYHRRDYTKLPDEDAVMEAMRRASPRPGYYVFPHAPDMKAMGSPEMIEKYKRGPLGFVTILPTGVPTMGKSLALWFAYCLVIAVFAAYLAGRTLDGGATYLAVFRVAGTAAFLAFGIGPLIDVIWKGQPWRMTLVHLFDGLVYSLLTGGTFGALWPR